MNRAFLCRATTPAIATSTSKGVTDVDRHPLIESILLAARCPTPQISAQVANIGPDTVAEVMLAEVASRAALLQLGPQLKFVIQCDLGFGDERLGYLFTLGEQVLPTSKRVGTAKLPRQCART